MSEELGFKHGPVEIKGGNLKSEKNKTTENVANIH
jgi:hypothetical protein